MRYGVTARRKRNVRRMARSAGAARRRAATAASAAGNAAMDAAEAEQSGKLVDRGQAHRQGASATAPIVADFSMRVCAATASASSGPTAPARPRCSICSPARWPPDSGTVRLGANLEMATLDQGRDSLDPDWTLSEALTGGRGDTVDGRRPAQARRRLHEGLPVHARAGAHAAARALGRRARPRSCWRAPWPSPSNLLVLDEPTNDLDLETLDLLQEMLADYAGTVILVSHDRDFLDRVVTR